MCRNVKLDCFCPQVAFHQNSDLKTIHNKNDIRNDPFRIYVLYFLVSFQIVIKYNLADFSQLHENAKINVKVKFAIRSKCAEYTLPVMNLGTICFPDSVT